MKLTKEQIKEMEAAAKPLWEFMARHCHPHTRIIVEHDSVELVEGVARGVNEGFAAPDKN